MNPVQKAIWYIESHFSADISLEEISRVGGVSRFYMSRAFGEATGRSLQSYLRGRRLSEAARSLADGAPDILTVALDAGYGSHEAFTRAFRDQFGLTPEALRAQRGLTNITLVEPIKMEENKIVELDAPRFVDGGPLLIAGLSARYNCDTTGAIPAQWQRFAPHIGRIPGQVGQACYGVCYNGDSAGNVDYICGVQVADAAKLGTEYASVRIPAQRYAVFTHRGHISGIRHTWNTIYSKALPEAKLEIADAPEVELYDHRFDPHTGRGEVEIWIPVKH